MKVTKLRRRLILMVCSFVPLLVNGTVFADSTISQVAPVQNFIKSIIQLLAGFAGLIATGFFVKGGFSYITSSGNPISLEKAKRTIFFSALGLAIVISAFVLSSIVTDLASNAFGK